MSRTAIPVRSDGSHVGAFPIAAMIAVTTPATAKITMAPGIMGSSFCLENAPRGHEQHQYREGDEYAVKAFRGGHGSLSASIASAS